MKKSIAIFLVCMASIANCTAQQYGWVDLSQNVPDSNYWNKNLRDIFFIGQEGWITGTFEDNLRVYHTANGGSTFTIQNVPENSGNGMGIFMRSLLEGYLVTNEGHVLRTTDGGNNWTTIGTGLGLLYSVSFPPLPDTSGYICGGWGGKICRVTGSNIVIEWTTPQTLTSIVFPVNSSEGWVCGGPTIRHRTSGGWQIGDQNYNAGNAYNAICFYDNFHGWAVGSSGSGQGNIIYTLNGTDWIGISGIPPLNLNDIIFIDDLEGWAVGNFIILHTTNGGLTWTEDPTPLADSTVFISVFAASKNEVYACGGKGVGDFRKSVLLKYAQIDGLEELVRREVEVWPNPTKGSISFKLPDSATSFDAGIYNLFGRLVWHKGQMIEHEIDISGLPPAVYILTVKTDQVVYVSKIIKQ